MYHRDKVLSRVDYFSLLAPGMVVLGKVVVVEDFCSSKEGSYFIK